MIAKTQRWCGGAGFGVGLCVALIIGGAFPAHAQGSGHGVVWADITDVLGRNLPSKIELHPKGEVKRLLIKAPKGSGRWKCPVGAYAAHVFVYDGDIPIMVDIQDIVVAEGKTADILVSLVEGTAGDLTVRAFDQDFDLVLDRVELAAGTNPGDPSSFPLCEPFPVDTPVLSKKVGWYKGELHCRSVYGGGTETVKKLVKRAEAAGLDFLAITDPNTMDACFDAGFESDKVALIPAMAWGSDQRGWALIYGPRTLPETAASSPDAQGVCQRVQAQGGIFAIAHPCFPKMPWQWNLSYVNAIEVWCRGWRDVPPITVEALGREYGRRVQGELVYPISQAAATRDLSANGQGALYWDYETVGGLVASPIAGSYSSDPSVPLGRPVTYVCAPEKSVQGILYGLRKGRTFVTSHKDGPLISFVADIGKDDTIDAYMGGVIPIGVESTLQFRVKNAQGKKVQLLVNGHPAITRIIKPKREDGWFGVVADFTPTGHTVYRVRVIDTPDKPGFGAVDVLAMSSPIYTAKMIEVDSEGRLTEDMIIDLSGNSIVGEMRVTDYKTEEGGKVWVRGAQPPVVRRPAMEDEGEFQLPPGATVQTLEPAARF
jgi:hypothetical protein